MSFELRTYYVYIQASKPRGVLYVGMTSDLPGRAWEHREHVLDGFTKKHWVDRLVYFEAHDDANIAARREWALKRWRRDWKINLVEKHNPTWRDLFVDVLHSEGSIIDRCFRRCPLHFTLHPPHPHLPLYLRSRKTALQFIRDLAPFR